MSYFKDKGIVTENQWAYIRYWIIVVVITEILMLLLNKYLFIIYLVIAFLFLGGFSLRIVHLYPGKKEPLILDFLGAVGAVMFAYTSKWLGQSPGRFFFIFISSLIIFPHLFYVYSHREIE